MPRGRPRQLKRKSLMSKQNPTWISEWKPEDAVFWNSTGKVIARRNLIWSIVAEHIGFSVWLIWSIVATKLPAAGFHFTTDELFRLVALPGLIGSPVGVPSPLSGNAFRRPQLDHLQRCGAVHSDAVARLFRQPSGDAVLADARGRLHGGSRRRQFCF